MILVKSLMQLPESHYKTALFMVPEKVQSLDAFVQLQELATYLETGDFPAFWAFAENCKEVGLRA